ncbi:NPC intracellular cholesterol transporter 2 [Bactrocera neohumeralis]|uniref:NPC intracellular cholesterol transporter 2 n=1 Tax=Bactrocera tryoni TaxID=59916 RepID=UPI001A965EF1|nr:NPC intracellular cholesterol transporter 2 [Bactrocera tryoni]XP_050318126.1 NPC intracellular cholesterol transporter 2 [Bactrocera neohumeralis]
MHVKFFYLKLMYLCNVFWLTFTAVEPIDVQSASKEVYKRLLSLRTLPFEDCGSQYDVLYVSVSGCSAIPCQMTRGSTVTVKVIFDDNGENTSYLRHNVRWIFNAIKTNAVITPDPCDDKKSCLLDESDGKSYLAEVFVSSTLPNIRGTMMWVAENASNAEVICFKIPIIVTTTK